MMVIFVVNSLKFRKIRFEKLFKWYKMMCGIHPCAVCCCRNFQILG